MICPTCRNVMIVVEHERIELDYCASCSGVWFDAGELELMLERMDLGSDSLLLGGMLALPEASTTEKKRKCPICGRKMKKVVVGQEPEVLIDVCPIGDGLWFDGGEVTQLLPQCVSRAYGEADSSGRMLTFLGETFKVSGSSGADRGTGLN